jgi:hypothetical protein
MYQLKDHRGTAANGGSPTASSTWNPLCRFLCDRRGISGPARADVGEVKQQVEAARSGQFWLITRRSQVQILPPLPKSMTYAHF